MTDPPRQIDWPRILLVIVALIAFPAGWAAHAYLPHPAPTPPAPSPTPTPPAPESGLTLTGTELYVVDAPYDCFLIASPAELVTITPEKGPITIRAKFAPGSGKIETKVFKGPHVFTVEAAGKGKVELLLVKIGAQSPGDVVHKLVDVDSGEGPRPPPPGPTPPTPPTPTPAIGPLRVLVISDSDPAKRAKYTAGQRASMESTKVLTYLNAHCAKGPDGKTPEWRMVRDNDDLSHLPQVWKDAMTRPRQALPWLIVGVVGGSSPYEGPLPGNLDEMLRLLQTYGGP